MRNAKKQGSIVKLRDAIIETLEQRQMLTVDLMSGYMVITGTAGDDVIHVHLEEGNKNTIVIEDNVDWGGQIYYYDVRTLSHDIRNSIVIDALEGADEVVVDETYGAIKFSFIIDGGDGHDTLIGGSGNDVIDGDTGDDYIVGGNGLDFLSAGDGFDTVYGSGNPDESVDIYYKNPNADLANSIHGGNDDDLIVGGPKNDRLYGDAGNDTISGMAGNDYIEGNVGDDSIDGGAGYDTIHGNNGDDFIDGGGQNDFLFGDNGNDTLYGNTGNDQLYGNNGDDFLYGDAGNDSLDGGAGSNSLEGDTGKDRFRIYGRNGDAEIVDYNPSEGDSIGTFKNTSTAIRKN